MQVDDPIVIVSAARTPQGNMLGCLSSVPSPQLGAAAIKAAVERAGLQTDAIHDVLMGCVLPAGLGQAPARQAAKAANIPDGCSATTINKMCGSGMKAIMLGHDEILAGSQDVVVAGGMENMSQAPYLVAKGRQGYRLGHDRLLDSMFLDGLEDAYDTGKLMGYFAEQTASEHNITRQAQDDFALTSLSRAQQAQQKGLFSDEITPITVKTRKADITVDQDEGPQTAKPEKIPLLKPAFSKEGTVTAANSSSISDGAAAVVLMRLSEAEKRGVTPLAKIITHSSFANKPSLFTTAPIGAMSALLAKTAWQIDDIDLFEINEAFAVVTLAAMQALKLPHEKVNIHGGACALGHPIGASGARIVVTLLSALKQQGMHRGVASLCIGGGEATALGIEIIN